MNHAGERERERERERGELALYPTHADTHQRLSPLSLPLPRPSAAKGFGSKGVFLLCKTTNASGSELEELQVVGTGASPTGCMLFEHIAWLAGGSAGGRGSGPWSTWASAENVGLVVGATDTASMARARSRAPQTWFLVPGIGAQGGALEATCAGGLRSDGMGLLISASRGISRAADPAAAAQLLRDQINECRATLAPAAAAAERDDAASALAPYQRELIVEAMNAGALKFGEFTLKSGRTSPYFFNAGMLFSSGQRLAKVAACYAAAVVRAGFEFDVVFGPAYKGIPLATAVGIALSLHHGVDVGIAYDRKEPKDHGEGGLLVGADMVGKRILLVDDVITAGTAIRAAVTMLGTIEGATVVGAVIALDRQEVRGGAELPAAGVERQSAVQSVVADLGIQVTAVAKLDSLVEFLEKEGDDAMRDALGSMRDYRDKYGVTY